MKKVNLKEFKEIVKNIIKEESDELKKNKVIIKIQRFVKDRKEAENLLKNNMDIFEKHKNDTNFDTKIAAKIQAKENTK